MKVAGRRPGGWRPSSPLSLTYSGLRALDLEIGPGELVGVVVADPAVAGALLDCLAREVEPDSGRLELDGTDVRELDLDALRAVVLVAAHDADLFEDTLVANVSATAADPDRVPAAMVAATADEVVHTIGTDAVLSERARSLSGGQRQRVALARALATDAPVLVLHDPTTAVEVRVGGIPVGTFEAGRTPVVLVTQEVHTFAGPPAARVSRFPPGPRAPPPAPLRAPTRTPSARSAVPRPQPARTRSGPFSMPS